MRRVLATLTAVVPAFVLVVSACAPAAAPTATSAPAPTRAAATAVPAAATPTPAPQTPTPVRVVPTAAFAFGKAEDLGSPDARILGSGGNWDFGLSVYEGLLLKALDGQMVPGLALSWKIAADGKAAEFALRKGVKWHNGDPFVAEDVKYTFESILDPELKSAAATNFRTLDRVEVLDDYRAVIYLKEPDATLLFNLEWYGLLVPAKYNKQVGYKEFAKRAVGTGPFKFVRWSPSEVVEMEGFADHWSHVPQVKTLLLKIVPEATSRMAMLKTGEVDMTPLSASQVKEVETTRGLYVTRTPSLSVRESMLGTVPARDAANKAVPLRDRRVRLALNYAIDKKAILDAVYNGEGVLTGSPIGPGALGYDPSMAPPYPYDPEKAKALLKEAGHADGFDLELYTAPTGDIRKEAEAMAGYLKAVGIRAKVVAQEGGQMIEDIRQGRVPPVTVGWSAVNPTGDIGTWLPRHPMTGGTWGGYSNPELDSMVQKLNSIYDLDQRSKQIGQIMKLLNTDAPYIFLYATNVFFGLRDKWEWQTIPGRYTATWWNVKVKR